MALSRKHQKTLEAVFAVRANIRVKDIESLVKAVGGDVEERAGSRVKFQIGNTVAVFHRPHPRPQTSMGTARQIRTFLVAAGIEV